MNKFCLVIFTVITLSSCFSLNKSMNRTISNKVSMDSIKDLESIIRKSEFIYLGENHEAMTDRTITEQIIKLSLNLGQPSELRCVFIEVPSAYNRYLKKYYNKELNYEAFIAKIPNSFHKMLSKNILSLYTDNKIHLSFMDLIHSKGMNIRNLYMAKYIERELNDKKCNKKILINGYRHLMSYIDSENKKIRGLPTYFKNVKNVKIAFIPSYCKHVKPFFSKTIPTFFSTLIDSPRNLNSNGNWSIFNWYVVIPKNDNC